MSSTGVGGVAKRVPYLLPLIPLLVSESTVGLVVSTGSPSTVHRAVILVAILVTAAGVGITMPPRPVGRLCLALVAVALLSMTVASFQPTTGGDMDKILALAGYLLPWSVFFLRWDRADLIFVMRAIARLPMAALALGVLLQVSGQIPLIYHEYTGVARLGGPLHPAYLGAIGMFAVAAALWLSAVGERAIPSLFVGLAVTVASGTRGPMLVAALLVAAAFFLGTKGRLSLAARVSLLASGAAAAYYAVPIIRARVINAGSSQGALSGRSEAWEFFWLRFHDHPWVGNGLGSNALLGSESPNPIVRAYFIAPHNTYLQLVVDVGLVGAVPLTLLIAAVYWRTVRWSAPSTRLTVATLAAALAIYAVFDNLLSAMQPAILSAYFLAVSIEHGRRSRIAQVEPEVAQRAERTSQRSKPHTRGAFEQAHTRRATAPRLR